MNEGNEEFFDQFMTRRHFINYGIGVGFTLAVQPIAAWAIQTSKEGLVIGTVEIPTQEGNKLPAYRAMPQGKGPFPVVLVIHEIFGVHEYIQDVCRRFAKLGYFAIAPQLFFRQGDPTQMKDISQIISQVVSRTTLKEVMADLDATVHWISASKQGDVSRMGVTGFCWGGRMTWMYADHHSTRAGGSELKAGAKLRAAAAWYGGPLVGELTAAQPKYPVDIASSLKVPVLGLYGGKDDHIPLDHIEKMRKALQGSKNAESKIVVYPDSEHGFHADYRPSYREKDAKEAWSLLISWFKDHGVK